jgi:hypothetical protein
MPVRGGHHGLPGRRRGRDELARRFEDAITLLEDAAAIFGELGDRDSVGSVPRRPACRRKLNPSLITLDVLYPPWRVIGPVELDMIEQIF